MYMYFGIFKNIYQYLHIGRYYNCRITFGIEICRWYHGGTHCQGAELLWDELGDLATVMEGNGDLGCAASDCRC